MQALRTTQNPITASGTCGQGAAFMFRISTDMIGAARQQLTTKSDDGNTAIPGAL